MQRCPKILITDLYSNEFLYSFIHLVTNLKRMFSFLKQYFKILASFLSVEDNTKDMRNEATLNR